MHDIIVIGGGPAGMTAALYALRNGKRVLLLEKSGFGGQITHSPRVENYPGTQQISGSALADSMLEQILAQGAEIELEKAVSVEAKGHGFLVLTQEGGRYEAGAVVLATGVKHRLMGLPGEQALIGEGISFCAVCDGDFYTGKKVCVVGGGNSALQEALLLSDKCAQVTVLQDLPRCTGEEKLQRLLFSRPNVTLKTGVRVLALQNRNGTLCGVDIEQSGVTEHISCDGLFVAIGLIPENEAFAQLAALDANGYFDTDERCITQTPGVYAAGDCRAKSVRQLTTAVADGAVAALAACRYLDGQ